MNLYELINDIEKEVKAREEMAVAEFKAKLLKDYGVPEQDIPIFDVKSFPGGMVTFKIVLKLHSPILVQAFEPEYEPLPVDRSFMFAYAIPGDERFRDRSFTFSDALYFSKFDHELEP